MKGRQGIHPCYNVQSVVDDKNGLIVQADAVNDANDMGQLADQIKGAEQNLQHDCQVACADAGYTNIEQMSQVESAECSVVVPSPGQVTKKKTGPFDKRQFIYDTHRDCYYCPEGEMLSFYRYHNKRRVKREYRVESAAVCRRCRHFGDCTKSKVGRTIVRHKLERLREKIEQRYEQGDMRRIYDRRKSRVEHPFGYMKQVLRFRQFSLRGRSGVGAEASLLATCFNLSRMIGLLGGVERFVSAMTLAKA